MRQRPKSPAGSLGSARSGRVRKAPARRLAVRSAGLGGRRPAGQDAPRSSRADRSPETDSALASSTGSLTASSAGALPDREGLAFCPWSRHSHGCGGSSGAARSLRLLLGPWARTQSTMPAAFIAPAVWATGAPCANSIMRRNAADLVAGGELGLLLGVHLEEAVFGLELGGRALVGGRHGPAWPAPGGPEVRPRPVCRCAFCGARSSRRRRERACPRTAARWHWPHLACAAGRSSGMRLTAPQCGQTTCTR